MMPLGRQSEAIGDGNFSAAFFASVDPRVWRDDTSIMKVIKFAAAIEGQHSQKFVRCHRPPEFKLHRQSTRTAFFGLQI